MTVRQKGSEQSFHDRMLTDDAPRDLPNQRQAMSNALSEGDMPPKMLAELRELGLF